MSDLTIGPFILAGVLLLASATQVSWADDAPSTAPHAKGSSPSQAPPGSQPPTGDDSAAGGEKFELHSPSELGGGVKPHDNGGSENAGGAQVLKGSGSDPKGEGGKVPTAEGPAAKINAIDSRVSDVNAIDTRITVQPRRLGGHKIGSAKAKLGAGAPGNFHTRRMLGLAASKYIVRNAIGLSVIQHEGVEQHKGEHQVSPAIGGAPGILSSTNGRLANANAAQPGFVQPNASRLIGPAGLNRGMISGTGVIHVGSRSPGIGGPANIVAGINGTALRRKR